MSEKTGQNVKNVNGRGSAELVHTNIVESLGRVTNKYTKHKSFTTPVLEIWASLYLTKSGAIFTSKCCQFSENHIILKNGRPMFIQVLCTIQYNTGLLPKSTNFVKKSRAGLKVSYFTWPKFSVCTRAKNRSFSNWARAHN